MLTAPSGTSATFSVETFLAQFVASRAAACLVDARSWPAPSMRRPPRPARRPRCRGCRPPRRGGSARRSGGSGPTARRPAAAGAGGCARTSSVTSRPMPPLFMYVEAGEVQDDRRARRRSRVVGVHQHVLEPAVTSPAMSTIAAGPCRRTSNVAVASGIPAPFRAAHGAVLVGVDRHEVGQAGDLEDLAVVRASARRPAPRSRRARARASRPTISAMPVLLM